MHFTSGRLQGRWDDALELQEKVLEASTMALGKEHPDTLKAMAHLAVTYWDQEQWDGALKLEEKVLEARRRVLSKEHPGTLRSVKNIQFYLEYQQWLIDVCPFDEILLPL
jgi:hypothetical protein